MPWPGVGRSMGNSGHHPSSMATSFCQGVPREVVISKHWELLKPPLQRGAGEGSDIPRKTQLRDSSYLVKSIIVVLIFFSLISLFHKISLGTSVRGDTEKCSHSLLKTEFKQWLTTAGPAHHTNSVFHPQRSLYLISFMPLQSRAAH